MTKYILNSGGIKHNSELKRKFHQELIVDIGNSPKFLLCNFAQGREYWEPKFQQYINAIAEDIPKNIDPSFELAMPAIFDKQCRQADIIYFHGGDDRLLQYWLNQVDLRELFEDKVIATNSASSNALVTHYWACDWRQCADGLGIIPFKFIPHYQSSFGDNDPRGPIDWQEAYDKLAAYGNTNLPIYALKEGEYIVYQEPTV